MAITLYVQSNGTDATTTNPSNGTASNWADATITDFISWETCGFYIDVYRKNGTTSYEIALGVAATQINWGDNCDSNDKIMDGTWTPSSQVTFSTNDKFEWRSYFYSSNATFPGEPILVSGNVVDTTANRGTLDTVQITFRNMWNGWTDGWDLHATTYWISGANRTYATPTFVSGGTNATVSATLGSATGSGLTATVSGVKNATVSATLGSATGSGLTATVTGTTVVNATVSADVGTGTKGTLTANVIGGTGSIISATLGSATGSGLTATVTGIWNATVSASVGSAAGAGNTATLIGGTGQTVSATIGNATAAGNTANVTGSSVVNQTISATIGNATAEGLTANVTGSSVVNATVSATIGNAIASGNTATVTGVWNAVVSATLGSATGSGLTATLIGGIGQTISATLGTGTGTGLTATVLGVWNATVSALLGTAAASGLSADVTGATTLADPTNLYAVVNGANVDLSWTHQQNLMTFDVERRIDAGTWQAVS